MGGMTGVSVLSRMGVGDHPPMWRRFSRPDNVLLATRIEDVVGVVAEAERLAREGFWVAGMLTYESAPAFDPALTCSTPGPMPLAWFACFPAAEQPEHREITPEQPLSIGPWSLADATAHAVAHHHIREQIAAGKTYQVNHTFQLRAPFTGDPAQLFFRLTQAQPTEYAAYLDLGRFAICSVSPELFVRRKGRVLTTQPMKGTAARSGKADVAEIRALHTSDKDVAENVMIVDLLRNDLARICDPGTVQVTSLCDVSTLPTLHTMTSTVRGRVGDGVDLVTTMRALFPCGSVTGAPKVSTMQIIASLETAPRGVYCGAIGLLAPGGDYTFSVPIRTAVVDRHAGEVAYGVGSGITYASTAEAEFAEVLTKARILDDLKDEAP